MEVTIDGTVTINFKFYAMGPISLNDYYLGASCCTDSDAISLTGTSVSPFLFIESRIDMATVEA